LLEAEIKVATRYVIAVRRLGYAKLAHGVQNSKMNF